MKNKRQLDILNFISENSLVSPKEIHEGIGFEIGFSSLKRILSQMIFDKLLVQQGNGKASKYKISPVYQLFSPVDLDYYFKLEIDERKINNGFNFNLMKDVLSQTNLFSVAEMEILSKLHSDFKTNVSKLTEVEYKKEMERLAIDLSWKSSQIEGNTYSLLETERLLKEKETAVGKTKDEAVMLLNHKDALDFILQHPDYLTPLSIAKIEDIHSILVKELGVNRNIRISRVGITGTNYKPLDNEFQIRDALNEMCNIVNNKQNVFEKALLVLLLLSYIQAFGDGNKRTARIVSNAMLLSEGFCPVSFRTIDSVEYKKAMLLFYEQNNITAFKRIFINQFEFAVKTYF